MVLWLTDTPKKTTEIGKDWEEREEKVLIQIKNKLSVTVLQKKKIILNVENFVWLCL